MVLKYDGGASFRSNNRDLVEILCKNCDFFPLDCDFHNDENKGSPCGGYLFFLYLINKGELTFDKLNELCKSCRSRLSKKT